MQAEAPGRPDQDQPVELVGYSADWPRRFAAEAELLRAALAPWLVGTPEHIGSTAVPGLAAKPIIDIMAPVESLQTSCPAIEAATKLGYCYAPYKAEVMHWFCKPAPSARTHHLHLVPLGSAIWVQRLAFRDALRSSPRLAEQYLQLKARLAQQFPFDREAYTQGKSGFVQAVVSGSPTRAA